MFDRSDLGLFTLDPQFKVIQVNWTLEKYFGLQRDDLLGRDMRQLLPGTLYDVLEAPGRFTETLLKTYESRIYATGLTCHVLPNDTREERWLEYWSTPIQKGKHDGGRLECYLDVTGQQEAHPRIRKIA